MICNTPTETSYGQQYPSKLAHSANLKHDVISDDETAPSCSICLTDITPATPGMADDTLYCGRQIASTPAQTLPDQYTSQTSAAPAIAHGDCVKALYQAWQSSPRDMRLPHCPQCQQPLSQAITLANVSQTDLLRRYKISKRHNVEGSHAEDLHYLGDTILLGAKKDPRKLAQLLAHKKLALIATHAKPEDQQLFKYIERFSAAQPIAERMKLLIEFYRQMPSDTAVSQHIEVALTKGLLAPLSQQEQANHSHQSILALAIHTPHALLNHPIIFAVLDTLCEQLTLSQLAQLCYDFHEEADRTYLANHPMMADFHFRDEASHRQLMQARNLALQGFKQRLAELTDPNGVPSMQSLRHLNKLRKHPYEPVRHLSKSAWNALANRHPTNTLCLHILTKKLGSAKGLSARDMGSLETLIHRAVDPRQQSLSENFADTQVVLAYPRQGKGLRQRDVLFQPFATLRNRSLVQQARAEIPPLLATLGEKETLTPTQISALTYLTRWAPSPIQQEAQSLLQRKTHNETLR